MVTVVPSPVDQNGNITFNRDEGLVIPIREIDDNGDPVSVGSLTRYFNIGHGQLRVSVPVDPNNSQGKLLTLTQAQLLAVPYGMTSVFSYTDEGGTIPIVLWEGTISERN